MSSRHAAPNQSVLVIGAGIVGLAVAASLRRRGHRVTVVDRLGPGRGASYGHAGGIAITWVSPQGLPGLARNLPGWLVDPLGPVAVRWPYLPRLVPWLIRFQRHRSTAEIARISSALADLMTSAWPAWQRLIEEIGDPTLVRHDGSLTVYRDPVKARRDGFVWELRERFGHEVRRLEGARLREAEPALSDEYRIGVFEPEAKWSPDPGAVTSGLVRLLQGQGVVFHTAEVTTLVTDRNAVVEVRTDRGVHRPDILVVAAGAWSRRLVRQLGVDVPLESERGYHVDLPAPGVTLERILSLAPYKLVATPMRSGIRLSGTAEFAGVDSPPDYRRARALIANAVAALPGLRPEGHTEWAGDRPLLPDSLPVIGRDPRYGNVIHAYGHSHIGFTLGPTTGEMVAALVNGEDHPVDLHPLRVDRFSLRRVRSG